MDKEKDIFSEIIKEKLTNYSLPVENDSWDKIEEQLNSISRGKTRRLWYAVVAVAASIALLFLLFPFNKKVYQNETANHLSDHEKEIIQVVPEKAIVQSDLPQIVEHPTIFRKSQSGKQLAKNELTVEVIPVEEIPENYETVQEEKETEEKSITEKPLIHYGSGFDSGKDVIIPVIRSKKHKSINISFGSGSNLLASNSLAPQQGPNRAPPASNHWNSDIVYYKATSTNADKSKTEEILEYENYPDVIHYPPLQIGLTFKKELSPKVAIESGIVYSYISSTFSKEYYKSKADLHLHYIGIPLNIHTRLYSNKTSQWGIYLSSGVMAEKGILSHFVQKSFFEDMDNTVMTVISNEKIKGLQWSVGVSPGFDYKIYNNYSIYLEPKFSYYFDNDQPESARTKHPVVISVNAGIRYAW